MDYVIDSILWRVVRICLFLISRSTIDALLVLKSISITPTGFIVDVFNNGMNLLQEKDISCQSPLNSSPNIV